MISISLVQRDISNLKLKISPFQLTARLRIRMLVLFLMVLLRWMTRTTRMFPMLPMMMMKEKRMGTMYGTEGER